MGGAERPRAIDVNIFISYNVLFFCFFSFLFYNFYATRVTLNAKSNISGGDRMRRSHKDPDEELCGTRRNASDFARTFFHRRKKDAKRSQKRAQKGSPFLYIYSLERALFGMVLGMGGGQ